MSTSSTTQAPLDQQKGPDEAGCIADHQEIDFVTLGMLIIDDIEFPPPRPPVRNILGGAGTYAALGARLLSPAPTASRRVGWIVDRGSDFPPQAMAQIASWQTSALVRDDPSRLTTRGWNGYDDPADPDHRSFYYATPKRRLQPDPDLAACPPLLAAAAVHICSGPERCRDIVTSLTALRRGRPRPLVIWEPVPDLCTPDNLVELARTLPLVDVCSPNHAELAALMGDPGPGPGLTPAGDVDLAAVERSCTQLLESAPLATTALVVRAGPSGCFVARNPIMRRPVFTRTRSDGGGGGCGHVAKEGGKEGNHDGDGDGNDNGGSGDTGGNGAGGGSGDEQEKDAALSPTANWLGTGVAAQGVQPGMDFEALFAGLLLDEDGRIALRDLPSSSSPPSPSAADEGVERWVPAFFTAEDAAAGRVVDPTGGGNTFLGALAVAMARGAAVEHAAVLAGVAASFAIEQIGMPELSPPPTPDARELWNGVQVQSRLRAYIERQGLAVEDYALPWLDL